MSFFYLFAINQPKKIAIKKNAPTLIVLLFCFSISLFSQDKLYTALTIPKDLTTDANAVVRNCSITIDIEDFDKMTVRERKVVTVLNKLGNADAQIYEHYDNDTRITELKAIVYNAFGKEIKKYRERDFTDVNAVSGSTLYSDAKVKYMDHTPVSYPYTIEIIRETKTIYIICT